MLKIKFNHVYDKIPESAYGGKTYLVGAMRCRKGDFAKRFIDYDTKFGKRFYLLPEGELILLMLLTTSGKDSTLWTTLRKWDPEKERYYNKALNEQIEFVITK
jgi:hypothetical protein